ncbi:SulP family inorganic anion transporter [Salsipaludibacter albus]|uniref:SulP family inorganic anion transporter n=1 Tax=Salsipaludibacter albus TaxID=2849650 RepID=UPI001EE4BA46|nr:SulP family inorganic anion transporter [Salsipaludibacter albus]MBY5162670.1 SulP family inorganic anion transporter [Salsipaludibacter albus]
MARTSGPALLAGIRPLDRAALPRDLLAGITLAALAIPTALGYATIAGMPIITGLYTLVVPTAVFAILCSSRHLVVGADSATAALLAAGIAGMASAGTDDYVALAGMVAIITGILLLLARVARLGFIADFLSRTVLVGFLTGVGIQVAVGQVPDMFGLPKEGSGPVAQLVNVVADLSQASLATVGVALGVAVVIRGGRLLSRSFPWTLVAVVGAIVASAAWDFTDHGIATLGPLPSGLPSLTFPSVDTSDIAVLVGVAVSLFVVILAQSAATSRAYAAKYDESFDEDTDLVGLGLSNVAAGLTGAFAVNGSPTKTQMADSVGGRTQVTSLTMVAIVVVVLLFLTEPLQYLPTAVLATVVFLIGLDLVDVAGMRKIFRLRREEFWVALLTAVVVVFVGVLQGILLAIFLSIVIHLRRSYKPRNTLVARNPDGVIESFPLDTARTLRPGLVVYHFAHSLYYANANQFAEEVLELVEQVDPPIDWFCLEASSVADVDYSAAETLRQVVGQLAGHDAKLVLSGLSDDVRDELETFGTLELVGDDAVFATVHDVIEAHRQQTGGPRVATGT